MALAYLRRHRSILNWLLVLVIASFIILYIPTFFGPSKGSIGEALANVGGLPITVGEFQRSYLEARQRYERMGRVTPEVLRSMGLENLVLENLVSQRIVRLEAKRLGLAVSDEEVAKEIATSPNFQQDGHFVGTEQYRRALESVNLTPEEYEDEIRGLLLRKRLETFVTAGVTVTPAEVEQEFRRRNEQVKAEYVLVDAGRFRPQLAVTDDDVKARFESKKASYSLPERRVVSYALVDQDALKGRSSVTDREIEAYYGEHRDEFKEAEQVCASHILVKIKARPTDADGHPEAEAQKIAEGLLSEVKAGADFAALAKAHSEDKGSATRGGDLQCFERGHMVPEFDDAAFSLQAGQTSDLVKTTFGYHIIRVASHREESVPPMNQEKERIRATLLGQRAMDTGEKIAVAIGDALRRGKSLEDAAKEQGISVAKSPAFARGDAPEPIGSPTLVAKAFDLQLKQASPEPFEVPRGVAFISLAEIQSSRPATLEEVKDKIKGELLSEESFAKALESARAIRAKAEKEGLEKAAIAEKLVRKETPTLVSRGSAFGDLGSGAALDAAAFSLPEKTLSEPIRVVDGYALVRILEKKPFDEQAFGSQKATLLLSLEGEKKDRLFQAYLAEARERVPVERHPDMIKKVTG